MKKTKFFSLLMTLLCVLMTTVTFAACGDDDDDPNKDNPGAVDQNIKTVNFTYTLELSQTYLDIADVTITYLDSDGNEQTEAIRGTSWTKTVTRNSVPTSFYAKPSFTLKEGVDATQKYDFNSNVGYSYRTFNAKGDIVTGKEYSTPQMTGGVKGENLENFLQRAGGLHTIKCNISSKGLPE